MGRYREAIRSYETALTHNPGEPSPHQYIGDSHAALGNFKSALVAYEEYLKVRPGDAAAWNSRGLVLFRLRRHKKALESYERASLLEPGNPLHQYNRAVILHRLGRTPEAVESLRKALRINGAFKDADDMLRRLEADHPVWWWDWWFGQSWPKRVVACVLLLLLVVYAGLPLVRWDDVTDNVTGNVTPKLVWNFGQDFRYYLIPVALILLVLLFPNIRRLGKEGVDFGPITSQQTPKQPLFEPIEHYKVPPAQADMGRVSGPQDS